MWIKRLAASLLPIQNRWSLYLLLALCFDTPVSGWFQERDSNVLTCCHLRCSNPSTRSHYCSPQPRSWAGFIEMMSFQQGQDEDHKSARWWWGWLIMMMIIVLLMLTWCNACSWHRALIWEAPETEGRLSVDGNERIIGIDFVQLWTL